MRTKTLLLAAAAVAAGMMTAQAQSNVYSANIVGYVNVSIQGGNKLDLLTVPLIPANGNYNITNILTLPDAADGALVYTWTGTAWDNSIPSWVGGFGWDTEINLAMGKSFFLQSPVAATVTFVGEVQTGNVPYTIQPGINFVANKVPAAQAWPGSTHGHDGDLIYLWTGTAWNNTIWGYVDGFGWDDGNGGDINGPALPVARGAVYQNVGSALTFTNTFNP